MIDNKSKKQEIIAHTSLRGIAAIIVIFYHLKFGADFRLSFETVSQTFDRGYLFVDLFFILSGFIMCYVYLNNEKINSARNAANYIYLRFSRIYPLHLFTLIALLVWKFTIAIFYLITHDISLSTNVSTDAANQFVLHLFLLQSWGVYDKVNWNIPSWSISAEFATYLVFPAFVYAFKKQSRLTVILSFSLSFGIYYFIFYQSGNLDVTTGVSLFRCVAGFLLGCIIFTLKDHISKISKWLISLGQILCLLLIFVCIDYSTNDVYIILPFAALIFLLWSDEGILSRILCLKILQHLGKISYSIYLTHYIVLNVMSFVWVRLMDIIDVSVEHQVLERSLYILVILFVTFIASNWCHKEIELRAQKYLLSMNPLNESSFRQT